MLVAVGDARALIGSADKGCVGFWESREHDDTTIAINTNEKSAIPLLLLKILIKPPKLDVLKAKVMGAPHINDFAADFN